MQPGDLVVITRASIGIPKGTIGLIVKARHNDALLVNGQEVDEAHSLYYVQLASMPARGLNGALRRNLPRDLKKIS